ncbi:MAG: hypothetical protein KA006_00680 [Neisseria sp.]|nr:hypothetical protein [Neisseria sp.]
MFEQNQVVTYPATLLGAKKFKGEIEGNRIDSCTVLVATAMPSNGNTVGFTAASMKFGGSHNFQKLENLKFPCSVDITVAMTSTGRGQVPVLLDFQVKAAQPPKG